MGPVLPFEGSRDVKDVFDPRVMVRNTVGLSPHYAYRSNSTTQGKIHVAESADKDSKQSQGLVNSNPYSYNQTHGQQPNDQIALDAKFMQQSRSQFGVVHMGLS